MDGLKTAHARAQPQCKEPKKQDANTEIWHYLEPVSVSLELREGTASGLSQTFLHLNKALQTCDKEVVLV